MAQVMLFAATAGILLILLLVVFYYLVWRPMKSSNLSEYKLKTKKSWLLTAIFGLIFFIFTASPGSGAVGLLIIFIITFSFGWAIAVSIQEWRGWGSTEEKSHKEKLRERREELRD